MHKGEHRGGLDETAVNDVAPGDTRRYLKLIGQGDDRFTFQTFHDKGNDKTLTHVINGTLDERARQLIELNGWGSGVFVTINQTELNGRRHANMVSPRAVWVEADDGVPEVLPLPPSITVEISV
jgi:hypothetical protein